MSVPYIYSLSPMVELYARMQGDRSQLESLAAGTAEHIASKPDVARSLQVPKVAGSTLMRQVNIQATPESPVVLVTWTCWDHLRNCWHVMMESPHENHFEKSQIHEALN